MKEIFVNGLRLFVFENLIRYTTLCHCVSTRIGGVSSGNFSSLNLGIATDDSEECILENHSLLLSAIGFKNRRLVSSVQVHGKRIAIIDKVPSQAETQLADPLLYGYDSLITSLPEILLMIRVADCVPLILFDNENGVLAVVHAGWKGTLGSIAAKTVYAMANKFKTVPEDIIAGIGPSVGKCCFEVSRVLMESFIRAFPYAEKIIKEEASRFYIDLKEANKYQLLSAGLKNSNIENSGLCTCCNSDIFFSHRREKGKAGRFALVAGIRG